MTRYGYFAMSAGFVLLLSALTGCPALGGGNLAGDWLCTAGAAPHMYSFELNGKARYVMLAPPAAGEGWSVECYGWIDGTYIAADGNIMIYFDDCDSCGVKMATTGEVPQDALDTAEAQLDGLMLQVAILQAIGYAGLPYQIDGDRLVLTGSLGSLTFSRTTDTRDYSSPDRTCCELAD